MTTALDLDAISERVERVREAHDYAVGMALYADAMDDAPAFEQAEAAERAFGVAVDELDLPTLGREVKRLREALTEIATETQTVHLGGIPPSVTQRTRGADIARRALSPSITQEEEK